MTILAESFDMYYKNALSNIRYRQDPQNQALLKDAGLLVLGRLAEYIIGGGFAPEPIVNLLQAHVLPDLSSPIPYIKARVYLLSFLILVCVGICKI